MDGCQQKGRILIKLKISDGPLEDVSETVDNENRTTEDLWTKLDETYQISNTKTVFNMEHGIQEIKLDSEEE